MSEFIDPFQLEFDLCTGLFAITELSATPLPMNRSADKILFQIGSRATKTYRAVLHLCVLGHGEQATMLNRALFEDVITAHWVNENPDVAVARLADHQKHTLFLWRHHMQQKGLDLGALVDVPDLTEEERRRYAKDFGNRGQMPWTGLSIFKMIEALEGGWGSANEQTLLWHMHDVHLRNSNMVLHVTSSSLTAPRVSEADPDLLHYDAGPSTRQIPIALMGAFWSYANLFRLVVPTAALGKLTDYYEAGMPQFFRKHDVPI